MQIQTAQDNFEMRADDELFENFYYEFQNHSSDIQELGQWTQSAMFALHLQLFFSTEYKHALERAENETIKTNNLVIPLFDNNLMRVNLLAIEPERNLPLHDHPGSAGSMMVISGSVQATICEYTTSVDGTNQPTNLLTIVENTIISAGKTSCFTKDQHNIHSFKAIDGRTIVMVVHTPPFAANKQSFFFTAAPPAGNRFASINTTCSYTSVPTFS